MVMAGQKKDARPFAKKAGRLAEMKYQELTAQSILEAV